MSLNKNNAEEKVVRVRSDESGLIEVDCPLCGSNRSKKLFDVKDWTLHCDDRVFSLRRCSECGCGYLSPRPPENEMSLYYPPRFYWSYEGVSREIDWPAIVQNRSRQLKSKAAWLKDLPPGRLLDIGAMKGEFLWFMQQKGWVVEGVELDNNVPNPAKMPIHYGDFLKMDFSQNYYDVITFWAVLEHVYHPVPFIEYASRLLKPGGRLVVLVTNLNSVQARFYRADDYPRHLTVFTASSAKAMCKKNGLRIERISTDQNIFGGALNGGLLYAFKHACGSDTEALFNEWKQPEDKHLFWVKWKGRPSELIRTVSRIDKALSLPFEYVLDRFGLGFNMTFSAVKVMTVTS